MPRFEQEEEVVRAATSALFSSPLLGLDHRLELYHERRKLFEALDAKVARGTGLFGSIDLATPHGYEPALRRYREAFEALACVVPVPAGVCCGRLTPAAC